MAKMRSRDCAVAFAAWWHHWAEKQRLRAAALRVVAHMQQVALSGSFTWWSYWAKKNSQIAAMALRMQSVLTGRAFVSWLEAVETWQSERADEVSAPPPPQTPVLGRFGNVFFSRRVTLSISPRSARSLSTLARRKTTRR